MTKQGEVEKESAGGGGLVLAGRERLNPGQYLVGALDRICMVVAARLEAKAEPLADDLLIGMEPKRLASLKFAFELADRVRSGATVLQEEYESLAAILHREMLEQMKAGEEA